MTPANILRARGFVCVYRMERRGRGGQGRREMSAYPQYQADLQRLLKKKKKNDHQVCITITILLNSFMLGDV